MAHKLVDYETRAHRNAPAGRGAGRGLHDRRPYASAYAYYTRHVVEQAVSRYESDGLDSTLDHYNRPESVDGKWYVFVIDEDDLVVGHPDGERRGLDVNGWVGTDANGYNFGADMLAAGEEGKWVSYVYRNPESGGIGADATGELELKHVWAVRHDGLLFASGWYISADDVKANDVDTDGISAPWGNENYGLN